MWRDIENPTGSRVDHLNNTTLIGDHNAVRHVLKNRGETRPLLRERCDLLLKLLTQEIEGVGYRAEISGKNLIINVGFSHPVVVEPPEGISFDVDMKVRQIKVSGYSKQVVGQVAADIRKLRPPEPYKGKGIRYQGEYVRRKPGKAGKTAI